MSETVPPAVESTEEHPSAEVVDGSFGQDQKSFGSKLQCYLDAHPHLGDVIFRVAGEKIRAFRLTLIVESPVFEKLFKQPWKHSVTDPGEPIKISDVCPEVFRIFLKLLTDDNCGETIRSLNLSPSKIMQLLSLCEDYQVAKLNGWLNLEFQDILGNFDEFSRTEEFLTLSNKNFNRLLSQDDLLAKEVHVFEAACRWAEHQCRLNKIDASGTNMRSVLGPCLFSVRFLLMSNQDFSEFVTPKNILSKTEQLEMLKMMSLPEDKRQSATAIATEILDFNNWNHRSKSGDLVLLDIMTKLNPEVLDKETPFPRSLTPELNPHFVELVSNNLHVSSSSTASSDSARLVSNDPIPPLCQVYYFEVTILAKQQGGHLRVGLLTSAKDYHFYYRSDGYVSKYLKKDDQWVKPPTLNGGDVIGCGIHLLRDKSQGFFTKNGELVGYAVLTSNSLRLHPFVKVGCSLKIRANFGQTPFKFNICEKTWKP